MTAIVSHFNTKYVMIQQTLFNWLSAELSTDIKWRHNFSQFSMTEKFYLVARHNRAKFVLNPKRGSRFLEEYSMSGFTKCLFSNSYFPFRNYEPVLQMPKYTKMVSIFNFKDLTPWPEEQYPIIKNYAV